MIQNSMNMKFEAEMVQAMISRISLCYDLSSIIERHSELMQLIRQGNIHSNLNSIFLRV